MSEPSRIRTFGVSLEVMHILEQRKIVRELMPQHDGRGGSIWSWEVLAPEKLPEIPWLQANLIVNNGIIVL
jgi:hypothetical protein